MTEILGFEVPQYQLVMFALTVRAHPQSLEGDEPLARVPFRPSSTVASRRAATRPLARRTILRTKKATQPATMAMTLAISKGEPGTAFIARWAVPTRSSSKRFIKEVVQHFVTLPAQIRGFDHYEPAEYLFRTENEGSTYSGFKQSLESMGVLIGDLNSLY